MKRVVVLDDLHEAELRPSAEYAEYIALLEKESREAAASAPLVKVSACPACQHPSAEPAFDKWGWRYERCSRCRSLYLNPGPSVEWLDTFLQNSAASRFWNARVVPESLETRRERLFRPRAAWVLDTVADQDPGPGSFIDYGTRHPAFLDEVAASRIFPEIVALKPAAAAAQACAAAGYPPARETASGKARAASAFEVLEGTPDPAGLVARLRDALRPGGLLLLSTRSASGFDVQVLRERAPNLLPPLHVTLLSVEGIMSLMQGAGFELIELSTPGQLDVEIVAGAARSDPTLELPPFIDDLIRRRDDRLHAVFQEFLQQARLSSHLRLTAIKRSETKHA